jgi:ABC-type transport system involved in multi-copper enzyme maturation permease subunit
MIFGGMKMRAAVEASAVEPVAAIHDWSLWLRQIRAILRIEVKKNFWGRRAILIYMLAAIPVFLTFLVTFIDSHGSADIRRNWTGAQEVFAVIIYRGLILQTIVYFGCAWIFMNLFRGEVVDKSLHYYFLCALRREVLVAGKYISGLVASTVLFTMTTVGSLFFLYYARGYQASVDYLFDGPGIKQCLAYIGITILACVGYGAVFMVIGLFFRNPIIPALLAYGWEWVNFLLPPLLKKISIIHYLHSLSPIPISEGPLATVVDPTPAWISIPSMIIFTAVVLILASIRIRRMEISYGNE